MIQNIGRIDIMLGKNLLKILIFTIISAILSCMFQYTNSEIINYNIVINIETAFFSVSLAIVALLITILEKYREKVTDLQDWAKSSTNILKEMCENTIALLLLIILIILASIFEPIIILIPKFDLMTTILLFSIIVSLCVIFDTTIGIYKLIIHLKDLLVPNNNTELILSQKEIHLVEAYRFLDKEHKNDLEKLIKAIATNQQLDSQNQQK